jgi:plastocyanin
MHLRKLTSCAAMVGVLLCLICLASDKTSDSKPKSRHEISIVKLQFKPAKTTIKVGETVIWSNNDERDHTVIADDGSFKSPNIKSGETFQFTFTKAGKFPYHCTYHPRMKGEIVVEQAKK